MNKIDEIKERLHQLLPTTEYKISNWKEESFKWASNYQGDIQHLLSKLEIAEKALEYAYERDGYVVLRDAINEIRA